MAVKSRSGKYIKKGPPKPEVVVSGYVYASEVKANATKGHRLQLAVDVTDDIQLLEDQITLHFRTKKLAKKYGVAVERAVVFAVDETGDFGDKYKIYPSKFLNKVPKVLPIEAGGFYELTLKINAVDSEEHGPSLFFNVAKAVLVNDEEEVEELENPDDELEDEVDEYGEELEDDDGLEEEIGEEVEEEDEEVDEEEEEEDFKAFQKARALERKKKAKPVAKKKVAKKKAVKKAKPVAKKKASGRRNWSEV